MGFRYKAACNLRRFPNASRVSCSAFRPSLSRSALAGRREQMAYWLPARGEVAEPGLRRTPGERVNSEGFRGFKSPPLRHRVCTA
jgi:hypothetical protein